MAEEISSFGRGTFDAQAEAVPCFKIPYPGEENDIVTEDCLTMDIYIPNGETGIEGNRGILFWIHGGGYQSGDSKFYSGIEQGIRLYISQSRV